MNLIDSQIHNNVAIGAMYRGRTTYNGGQGGAIFGGWLETIHISRTNIYNNTAVPYIDNLGHVIEASIGGAMSLVGSSHEVLIESSAIFGNSADQNGGVNLEGTNAIFKNVTISGNQALTQSGGLGLGMEAVAVLSHTTIASNTSPVASITLSNSQVRMDHVLVSTDVGAGCLIQSGSIDASAGHNLSSDASCALTGTTNLSNTNPLIGPLSQEMSTWVHALLPASPAINTGSPPQQGEVDQVGWPRKWGGEFSDIGAYERIDFSALTRVMLPVVLAMQ